MKSKEIGFLTFYFLVWSVQFMTYEAEASLLFVFLDCSNTLTPIVRFDDFRDNPFCLTNQWFECVWIDRSILSRSNATWSRTCSYSNNTFLVSKFYNHTNCWMRWSRVTYRQLDGNLLHQLCNSPSMFHHHHLGNYIDPTHIVNHRL